MERLIVRNSPLLGSELTQIRRTVINGIDDSVFSDTVERFRMENDIGIDYFKIRFIWAHGFPTFNPNILSETKTKPT